MRQKSTSSSTANETSLGYDDGDDDDSQDNVVDVLSAAMIIRIIMGTLVFFQKVDTNEVVSDHFSYVGCAFFLTWYATYLFCVYLTFLDDMSITRSFYDTKLGFYGDYCEITIATVYVMFMFVKIPFGFNKGKGYIQVLLSMDHVLKEMGKPVDHNAARTLLFYSGVGQIVFLVFHVLCLVWIFIFLDQPIPFALIFVCSYVNALTLNTSVRYSFFLYLLKQRYEIVNDILRDVKSLKKYFEPTSRVLKAEEKQIASKIRSCSRLYNQLDRASEVADRLFGFALTMSLLACVLYIILHMFYFMEIHAAELFLKDYVKYMCFLVNTMWETFYDVSVIVCSIVFCEDTIQEAKASAHIVHQIINKDMSSKISAVSMQLSQQLLHQSPAFSTSGIFKLEYLLLIQGARSVAQFLVILLQFITKE